MSDGEILLLKRELEESQEKLCKEKHGTIDRRLEKMETKIDKMFWWLLGIMATAIVNLAILLINK